MTSNHTQYGTYPEWMDLKTIRQYACVSERTLRDWIHRPFEPLPAVQVEKKILIRRTELDRWLESHRLQPGSATNINGIVEEVMKGMTIN